MAVLYEKEDRILKIISKRGNKIISDSGVDSRHFLKKKRELFNALVFLSLESGKRICVRHISMPKDGEGADVVISGRHKRVLEITECFDGQNNYAAFENTLNNLLSNKLGDTSLCNMSNNLKMALHDRINDKNDKISSYKKTGYCIELLLVTNEAYDNCPITGSWIEKFLDKNYIKKNTSLFDKVHILIYHSSGKDNGPRILEYPDCINDYKKLIPDELE